MASQHLLAPTDLAGTWILSRTIEDRLLGERSSVHGTTELVAVEPGRVRWAESGVLRRGDLELPVSRVLFVTLRGDDWWVTFEDGRDFHPWAPGQDVVHPCAPDTYAGRIDVADDDHWSVAWTATGPAKDYSMTSRLVRDDRSGDQSNENA